MRWILKGLVLLMAITFKSQGAGEFTEASGVALTPPCPASVDAGDILVAHVFFEGLTAAPSTPTGWDPLFGPRMVGGDPGNSNPVSRHWLFGRIADGSEDGASPDFGSNAVTSLRGARIYSFGGRVSGTIQQLVKGLTSTIHLTDPEMPTVRTTKAGALACAFVAQNDNNSLGSATGESGGDWTEAVAEFIAAGVPGCVLQLQTCTPTGDPGTVTGGTVAATNDPAGVIGCQIIDEPDPDGGVELVAEGEWLRLAADGTVPIPCSPAAGDRMFLFATWKDFAITVADPSGWTPIDSEFADGSVSAGSGTGSVKVMAWYRDWQSGDSDPTIDWSSNPAEGHAVIQVWRKGANLEWDDPVDVTAAQTTWTTTQQTTSASSTVDVPDGSVVMALHGVRDNSNPFSHPASGIDDAGGLITWDGDYFESPWVHFSSDIGAGDMAGDLGHRFVSTGDTGVTLRQTGTLQSTDTGAMKWVVQGVTAAGGGGVTGEIDATLAGATANLDAIETIPGALAAVPAGATSNLQGLVANPVTGALAATLDGATANLDAIETFVGELETTTGPVEADLNGIETIPGEIETTLAGASAAFEGVVLEPVEGELATTLQGAAADFEALVVEAVEGALDAETEPVVASFIGRVGDEEKPIGGLSAKLHREALKLEDDRPSVLNAYGYATLKRTACIAHATVEEDATAAASLSPTGVIAFGVVKAPPVAVAYGLASISSGPVAVQAEAWSFPPADPALAELLGLEAIAEEIS